jgi:hypothetical protein
VSETPRIFFGVDPGKDGGIVAIDSHLQLVGWGRLNKPVSEVGLDPLPLRIARVVEGMVRQFGSASLAVVEDQTPFAKGGRKMGATSAFHLGENFGSWVAALKPYTAEVKVEEPKKWKKELGLSSEKALSVLLAERLFPPIKFPDHNKAEAVLLAFIAARRGGVSHSILEPINQYAPVVFEK